MGSKYQGNAREIQALDTYIKLQRAAETVMTETNAHLSNYDLSTSQFAVLEALYHLGTLSQGDLAIKLLKTTGNMTTVLKNLEKRRLLTRDRDPNDNRYRQICITDSGRALIEGMLKPHVQGIVEALSILTDEEQEELARLCKKLGLGLSKNS